MLGEAFEVLLNARCMLWFSTDMEWTPLSLFNRTYIYKWWVFQPATVCVLSIRFHVTLRAISLPKFGHPPTSTWKHCFFFGVWGKKHKGATRKTTHCIWQRSPCAVSAMLRAAVILAALLPSDGLERVESWIDNLSNGKAYFLVVGDMYAYTYIICIFT